MANWLINGEQGMPSAPSLPDTRVWMYRGQEATLFNSKDEIPAGEDWREAPYELESPPVKKSRAKKSEGENGDGN
jgi:hypothetical protein